VDLAKEDGVAILDQQLTLAARETQTREARAGHLDDRPHEEGLGAAVDDDFSSGAHLYLSLANHEEALVLCVYRIGNDDVADVVPGRFTMAGRPRHIDKRRFINPFRVLPLHMLVDCKRGRPRP